MSLRTTSALLALALLPACNTTAGGADNTDAFATTTSEWHSSRLERLSAPDGWLSLVTLAWLDEGANRIGSATDAQVSYAGLPAEHIGTLHVDGIDEVRFDPAPGIDFEGLPDDGYLLTDADGPPTILTLGDVRFYVILRGERLAVRMKDANAPTRTDFAGIECFPADPSWVVQAELVPAGAGESITLATVLDDVTAQATIAARARFEHEGHPVEAVLFPSGDGYTLRFSDTTAGGETYPIGRYLYVDPSPDGATVLLDMNRAYNPPCAFTEFATCTLAPAANQFPFAVTAGEKRPAGH